MKKISFLILLAMPWAACNQMKSDSSSENSSGNLTVKIANGTLEGISHSGIRIFKGIPYAQPPVGDLRWKEPQPVKNWEGIRKANQFGPRAMQKAIFGDMGFRSNGMSEDCLYLNVWTPAKSSTEKLPVLVYFYGGGFVAGDGSEARYDGESMARKGIVSLTVNYRLGVFGFLAHPELSKETSYHGSGNYALMDQRAALLWVQQNIAAFGGDPKRVTIAGESAGSISVCAQMASPLSKNLIAGAIGESGGMINPTLAPVSLAAGEEMGVKFAKDAGAKSLAELRALPADTLLDRASRPGQPWFMATVDGYFFPKLPVELFASGEQAQVPLLLGWNSEEMNYRMILWANEPTPENYSKALTTLYKEQAAEALRQYPGSTRDEVIKSATDLAGDRFISYSTWKWYDLHLQTGKSPVYRYYYSRPRPAMRAEMGNATPGLAGGVTKGDASKPAVEPPATGAVHSAEIEYAMGNLPSNRVYDWQVEDFLVSAVMQDYFANFIKTGNPNGMALPVWPQASRGNIEQFMCIDVNTRAETEKNRERYLWLDKQFSAK
jgi:para-nitrobenzyl esterase